MSETEDRLRMVEFSNEEIAGLQEVKDRELGKPAASETFEQKVNRMLEEEHSGEFKPMMFTSGTEDDDGYID